MTKKDKNDWSYFLEKGEYFESQNNFDEAIKYYEEMVRLFPRNYNGWFKRGLIRRKNNDIKGAIEDYTKSISLEPVYQAFANRAVAFLALDDNESALKDLNKALELNPNDDIALRNRGQLKITQGELLESINDFDRAIKISPENPQGFHCRAFAKYHINDKKGAQEDWNKAVDMGYEISSKALKDYFHESKVSEKENIGYKLAPDWYFLEAANMAAGIKECHFKTLEIAKEESEKYRKEALAEGKDYEEVIFTQRCLPPGKYFIGDPLAVIDDYEDKEKWPNEANDVFISDDGTYFALFHANLGPRTYLDEDRYEFLTESGDIIIIQFEKIDQKENAENLAEYGGGYIFESKFSIDVGKDRQCDGAIDYGGYPVIFTDHEMWFNDEV